MKKTVKIFLSLMLAAACAVSVITVNSAEVSAKNKYKKGDYITFGSYEQDGKKKNGAEPIEWEVLDVKNGKALVISKYILDAMPYNDYADITWEKCALRQWLNKDFYNSAFKAGEKKKIIKTRLLNPDHKKSGIKGGKATKDSVFLLSVSEIRKYYKFNSWDERLMCGLSQELMTEGTKYAIDNGLATNAITEEYYDLLYKSFEYNESCIGRVCAEWWLRTPGYEANRVCAVSACGDTGWDVYDAYAHFGYIGVRPAMWVKL